jgi:isomerase DpgB
MITTDIRVRLGDRADACLPIESCASLTPELTGSVQAVCDRIEDAVERGETRPVVVLHLTGGTSPDHADGDVNWPGDGADVHEVNRWERALRRLERLPAAVIAVAEGHCTGPAIEVLLTADYRIGAVDVSMGLPVRSGQVWPGMSVHRLATQVGIARARQLVLFGRNVPADVARRIGLLDEVATDVVQAAEFALNLVGGVEGSELAIRRRLLLDAATTSFEDARGVHLAACDRTLRRPT